MARTSRMWQVALLVLFSASCLVALSGKSVAQRQTHHHVRPAFTTISISVGAATPASTPTGYDNAPDEPSSYINVSGTKRFFVAGDISNGMAAVHGSTAA